MKRLIELFALLILTLSITLALSSCKKHVHTFGEWETLAEPTFDSEGEKSRVCSECQEKENEKIPALVATYYITIAEKNGETKIPVAADGKYYIPYPDEFTGYSFVGYYDEDGELFLRQGTLTKSVTVYPKYNITPTYNFEELKERMEAGSDIVIAADITLSGTIYVSDSVTVSSSGQYTLTRSDSFSGDLFIIGTYPDGSNPLLDGKTPSLTLKPTDGYLLTLDGNKNKIKVPVSGTAFFIKNSGTLNIYDGFEIVNCKKTQNSMLLTDAHHISDPNLVGGPAVITVSGAFNMYGGAIRNCEADMDDSASTPTENQTEGYNDSSRGGAIFNHGAFNMYGGVIENCKAGRGGAIYNYKVAYLYGGEVKNNHTSSYGGAIYNPNSQYIYTVIGEAGQGIKMSIIGNTSDKTGGAIYSAHQSTVYVTGSTLFKENRALGGNGGAINAAGAVVIDYAIFENNSASSKGGAIYAYYNSPGNVIRIVEIKAGVFTANSAPRGGAIALSCGDEASVGTRAEIGNVEFSENLAPLSSDGKYGYGAAIHVDQASTLNIYGSATFKNNTAKDNGGAIYITKASTMTVSASSGVTVRFTNNISEEGNGGALYITGSTVILNAGSGRVFIENNSVTGGNGGAIAVHSKGTVKLYGVTATGNSAPDGNGGALYLYGGYGVIGDASLPVASSFKQNSADKGGAIYVSSTSSADASLDAYKITATLNTASAGGGAIYIVDDSTKGATLKAELLELTQNEAGGNGGAMYIYTNAKVCANGITATENRTASGKYGGFAYISGKAEVTFGSIVAKQNTASSGGCIYITTSGTSLSILSGDITENTADSASKGHAIWSNSKDAVLMLKKNAEGQYLLLFTEGDILGKSGFEIKEYSEVAE